MAEQDQPDPQGQPAGRRIADGVYVHAGGEVYSGGDIPPPEHAALITNPACWAPDEEPDDEVDTDTGSTGGGGPDGGAEPPGPVPAGDKPPPAKRTSRRSTK